MTPTSLDTLERAQAMLAELKEALDGETSELPEGTADLLRTIHRTLAKDEEVVTALTDEELAPLMVGINTISGHKLAAKEAKKRPKKKLSDIGVDDI